MLSPSQWLLIRAGEHLVAAPASQVRGLAECADVRPADAAEDLEGYLEPGRIPVRALAYYLDGSLETPGGVILRVSASNRAGGLRVRAVEDLVQGPQLLPLPPLLCRALDERNPVIGAITWHERPILVVDLDRCVSASERQPDATP